MCRHSSNAERVSVYQGDLVYVNYCRVEDFVQLLYENVTVEGNIAICRYEKIYRGDKVRMKVPFELGQGYIMMGNQRWATLFKIQEEIKLEAHV